MNAVFTPGPWRINSEAAHPWIVECPTTHPAFSGQVCTVGYKPNAVLIAASPALFQAAEVAMRLLDGLVAKGVKLSTVERCAYQDLAAALQRARGE